MLKYTNEVEGKTILKQLVTQWGIYQTFTDGTYTIILIGEHFGEICVEHIELHWHDDMIAVGIMTEEESKAIVKKKIDALEQAQAERIMVAKEHQKRAKTD